MTDLDLRPPPLSDDDAIAQVSAVLDNLRAAAAAPFAAVNPDGSPGTVAAGELIESAWGNAVVERINTFRGVGVTQTGQSIPSGGTALLAWSTETYDTDNYHPPGADTITIPANRAGTYGITAAVGVPSAASQLLDVTIIAAGGNFTTYVPVGKLSMFGAIVRPLVVAQTVQVRIYNGHSNALFFSGSLEVVRLGP